MKKRWLLVLTLLVSLLAPCFPVRAEMAQIGNGIYMAGIPTDQLQFFFQMRRAVGRRVQVGHGAYRGVAAVRRRACTGGDGFFIRKTRFPQMNVNIYETG